MPRSLQQILDHADELAERFERYEPQSGDVRNPLPSREALEEFARTAADALGPLAQTRAGIESAMVIAIGEMRKHGRPWSAIGRELGTSGEAARQRYSDLMGADMDA